MMQHPGWIWSWRGRGALLAASLALLLGCASRSGNAPEPGPWTAAWGSAQLAVEPLPAASASAPAWREPLRDTSLRQVLRVTVSGSSLRVQISNLMGQTPLVLGASGVWLAQPQGPRAGAAPQGRAGSFHPLRFAGLQRLELPPGAQAWSDAVPLRMERGDELLLDLHLQHGAAPLTAHPGSRIASWAVPGDAVGRPHWEAATPRIGWWHVAAVDVQAARTTPVLVATGDSITDGYGVPPGSYQRWTDVLVQRLAAASRDVAVVNTGIGGNRLLRDGAGPKLLARFERDVLARSGVTHAVLLIGVNDLGVQRRNAQDSPAARAELLQAMQQALRALALQARARGVCLIGATVLPYAGSDYYRPGPDNEADRRSLNDWIRGGGSFDAVIDFDALLRDPARPDRLRAEFDSGDGLHPSMAGYRAMAEAFPLPLLDRRCAPAPATRTPDPESLRG